MKYLSIFIRVALLALWQSLDCHSASEVSLMDMGKSVNVKPQQSTAKQKPCAYFLGYTVCYFYTVLCCFKVLLDFYATSSIWQRQVFSNYILFAMTCWRMQNVNVYTCWTHKYYRTLMISSRIVGSQRLGKWAVTVKSVLGSEWCIPVLGKRTRKQYLCEVLQWSILGPVLFLISCMAFIFFHIQWYKCI